MRASLSHDRKSTYLTRRTKGSAVLVSADGMVLLFGPVGWKTIYCGGPEASYFGEFVGGGGLEVNDSKVERWSRAME